MTWRDILFISMWPIFLGAGFLLWPQKMFRLRTFASGDGLTADGETAYRRLGIAWILFGVGFAVWAFVFL